MSSYKHLGIFQSVRTIRRWIVVIDGEEFPFEKKRHALMSASAAKDQGLDTRLIEDTTMRFRSPAAIKYSNQNYQIDITNQIP